MTTVLTAKEAAKLFGGNKPTSSSRTPQHQRAAVPVSITRAPLGAREFVIPGAPVPKPRMTQRDKFLNAARPCVSRYWAWVALAQQCAPTDIDTPEIRLNGITLSATFYLPLADSRSVKEMGRAHRQRPDLKNLTAALEDALWPKDEIIWRYHDIQKRFDDGTGPRTIVRWSTP
jgi:Holliday junction resolvase RusA-like endonuclease